MLSDLTSIYAEAWKASFLAANPFHSVHWREEDLVHVHAGLTAACAERDARIAELIQQLEEARKDAERYRLLRRGQHWSIVNGIGDELRGDFLDSAVDAARAAIKEQT